MTQKLDLSNYAVVTDDMTSSARLIKTINYGPDGTITRTLREMTTWQ